MENKLREIAGRHGRVFESVGSKHGVPIEGAIYDAIREATGLVSSAGRDVLAERQRQVEQEGYDAAQDDGYTAGEMASAAAAYAIATYEVQAGEPDPHVPVYWPWPRSLWKPTTPRRNLVKAAALILAELERLDRASEPNSAITATDIAVVGADVKAGRVTDFKFGPDDSEGGTPD